MSALLDDSLVIVLAGGAGERLYPLTKERAKPAVYFGGPYRIIDFVLSNCINSGLRRVFIATQYKSLSLNRHIRMGWNVVSEELGEFVEICEPLVKYRIHTGSSFRAHSTHQARRELFNPAMIGRRSILLFVTRWTRKERMS